MRRTENCCGTSIWAARLLHRRLPGRWTGSSMSRSRVGMFCSPSACPTVNCARGELQMKFSAITLVLAVGIGFVLGTMFHEQHLRVALAQAPAVSQAANDGKLRIIVFGAHPDDAEYRGAGVAMKWAKLGHHVKLVS